MRSRVRFYGQRSMSDFLSRLYPQHSSTILNSNATTPTRPPQQIVRSPHSRSHTSTPIDTQNLTIDPLAVLRGQESDNTSNVLRLADTEMRRPGGGVGVDLLVAQVVAVRNVLLAHGVVHVRLDPARRDAVDRDLLVAAVWSSVLGECKSWRWIGER